MVLERLWPRPGYYTGCKVRIHSRGMGIGKAFIGLTGIVINRAGCRRWIFFGPPVYRVSVYLHSTDYLLGVSENQIEVA